VFYIKYKNLETPVSHETMRIRLYSDVSHETCYRAFLYVGMTLRYLYIELIVF